MSAELKISQVCAAQYVCSHNSTKAIIIAVVVVATATASFGTNTSIKMLHYTLEFYRASLLQSSPASGPWTVTGPCFVFFPSTSPRRLCRAITNEEPAQKIGRG